MEKKCFSHIAIGQWIMSTADTSGRKNGEWVQRKAPPENRCAAVKTLGDNFWYKASTLSRTPGDWDLENVRDQPEYTDFGHIEIGQWVMSLVGGDGDIVTKGKWYKRLTNARRNRANLSKDFWFKDNLGVEIRCAHPEDWDLNNIKDTKLGKQKITRDNLAATLEYNGFDCNFSCWDNDYRKTGMRVYWDNGIGKDLFANGEFGLPKKFFNTFIKIVEKELGYKLKRLPA